MLHKSAITNTIFLIDISDMHHRITYMYINFQQNWVSRSVKTVRTNIFTKNCKLHKFATILIILFFKSITSESCITIKRTSSLYQFSAKSGL